MSTPGGNEDADQMANASVGSILNKVILLTTMLVGLFAASTLAVYWHWLWHSRLGVVNLLPNMLLLLVLSLQAA